MREFDFDEGFSKSDEVGDCIAPSGQPWDMPEFSEEDALAVAGIASDLIESGEWADIEARIISSVGKFRIPS